MKAFYAVSMLAGVLMLQACGLGADALTDLPKWKMGDPVCVPDAVEKQIQGTPVDQRGAIEDALIAVAGSAEATPDARQYACRLLQRVGTQKCVPVLAGLLTEKEYSHFARLGLERMKDVPEAGKALQEALGKAADPLKVGIIDSLGERRDEGTAALLQDLTGNADAQVAAAAYLALGKTGGADVLKFLKDAKASEPVAFARLDALLACAGNVGGPPAAEVFADVYEHVKSDAHRAGALIGLVRTDEAKAASIVMDLLRGEDSYLRRAALTCVASEKSTALTRAVAGALKDLPTATRATLIGLLAARGDSAAAVDIVAFLQDPDNAVRDAALQAVGALGTGQQVPELLKSVDNDATRESALAALAVMPAADVDDALIAALRDDATSVAAVKTLARRDCIKAVPELMRLAKTDGNAAQSEAWTALGTIAEAKDMDALMAALLEIKDPKLRGIAGGAVKNACSLSPDKQTCFAAALKYFEKADQDTQAFIIDLASVTGGEKALGLVRSALKSGNQVLYDKAVRSLCSWTEPGATGELMDLARNAPDEKTRILALRGYMNVAEREANDGKKAKLYLDARELIKRPDEKRLLVSKLASVRDSAATNLLSEYLDDAEVCEEAGAAVVDQAKSMGRRIRPEFKPLLDKVLANCKGKDLLNRAKAARNSMGK